MHGTERRVLPKKASISFSFLKKSFMSIYNYIATAQPATAIQKAIKANFIDPERDDLVVSKETCIEIYKVAGDSLVLTYNFDLYGRIEAVDVCQLPDRATCSLFILTDQGQYCTLSYNAATNAIITENSGSPIAPSARQADNLFIAVAGRNREVIVSSSYTALLHVYPALPSLSSSLGSRSSSSKGKGKMAPAGQSFDPFYIKINELLILSMTALYNHEQPTIAILYADEKETRYIKTYTLNIKGKDIFQKDSASFQVTARSSDHMLVAVPGAHGGILAISDRIITYYDLKGGSRTTSINFTVMTAHEFIGSDGKRCLLGDFAGNLYLLSLNMGNNGNSVQSLSMNILGSVSRPTSIVQLTDRLIFCSSAQGDSSLIKLGPNLAMSIVDEIPSLAPVTDFCLYDLDKHGRQTMVCCSGADNNGSLRIVQGGVDFVQEVELPIKWVKKVFTLRDSTNGLDNALVVATVFNTRVFHVRAGTDVIEEMSEFGALELRETTLAIESTSDGSVVQITPSGIHLVMGKSDGAKLDEWKPNEVITVATVHDAQIAISSGLGVVHYLEVMHGRLVHKGSKHFDHEISCLDISPLNEQKQSEFLAVGFWGGETVHLLNLPSLMVTSKDTLADGRIPHTALLSKLENVDYLFLTLGDGQIVYYQINSGSLHNRKEITLGTQTASLHTLIHNGARCIFAASDRPTIITSEAKQLNFSAVNAKELRSCNRFNSTVHNGVVVSTDRALIFGYINPIRKLNFTKISLGNQMGRRIVYHESSKTLVVGTSNVQRNPDDGFEKFTGWIRIFDARTLQDMKTHNLLENEVVESMTTAYIPELESELVFIGTAITDPNDKDQLTGRVLAFQVLSNSIYKLIDAVPTPNVVYSMKPFFNSVVMSIGGHLYYLDKIKIDDDPGKRLQLVPKHHGNAIALSIDTKNDMILVGDMVQSMSLIKADNGGDVTFQRVARDYNPEYMHTVKILEDNIYLGAEVCYNLFTMRRRTGDNVDSKQLELVGEFHLGDQINCIKQGALVERARNIDDKRKIIDTQFVYATASGAIGVITSLAQDQYDFLLSVQQNILKVAPRVGDLDHRTWRMFNNSIRKSDAHNFIDGDVIEKFLKLTRTQKEKVINGGGDLAEGISLPCTVEKLESIIRELGNNR
ncbi:CPSF A subunit region-domain-containing protein [Dichotomocladium elegans]|nr:CPSF A subunit region-domain-containing protein [Dichotomocladium elegans]